MSRKRNFGRYWQVSADDAITKKTWLNNIRAKGVSTADTDPNELELTIINLDPDSIAFLDREGVNVELKAGYKSDYGLAFKGAVKFVKSGKMGQETETVITLRDGEIHWNSLTVNVSFKKGTSREKVIKTLFDKVLDLPQGVKREFQQINQATQGKIDIIPTILADQTTKESGRKPKERKGRTLPEKVKKRRESLAKSRSNAAAIKLKKDELIRGMYFEELEYFERSFGLKAIWNKQALHIIPEGVALAIEAPLISPDTGLVGTVEKLEKGWRFTCEYLHTLEPGHLVYVDDPGQFTGTLLMDRVEMDLDVKGNSWYNVVEGREYNA